MYIYIYVCVSLNRWYLHKFAMLVEDIVINRWIWVYPVVGQTRTCPHGCCLAVNPHCHYTAKRR